MIVKNNLKNLTNIDVEKGEVSGTAIVLRTPDFVGDTFDPNLEVIVPKDRPVDLLYNHSHNDIYASTRNGSLEMKMDPKDGLNFKAKLYKEELLFKKVKDDLVDGVSAGFLPIRFTKNKDGSKNFTKILLKEISLTWEPAHTATIVKNLSAQEIEDQFDIELGDYSDENANFKQLEEVDNETKNIEEETKKEEKTEEKKITLTFEEKARII